MKARVWLAILLLACGGIATAIEPLPFENAAQRERFQELTAELRCMVCQNESLADSDAELAHDLRRQILAMMQTGKTDDEIKAYLVARYSEFVLYQPPVKPGTWLLWFGPVVILIAGAIAVAVFVRRRVARTDQVPGPEEDW